MPRVLDADTVRKVQRTALANGGSVRPFADGSHSRTVQWDISGRCLAPVTIELHGRARPELGKKNIMVGSANKPNFVVMEVRCRKCANCLRQKGWMWTTRARSEYRNSHRTWLATLTLSPTGHVGLLSRARVRLAKGGTDYDGLLRPDQFLEFEKEGFRELQKWLKRLRKNTESPFRYLAITEAHKSGVPHWHVLLHEQDPERPLRYDKMLKDSWTLGFDSYKLARDAAGASYAAKYLSKDIRARVRASLDYGGAQLPPFPPLAEVQCQNARKARNVKIAHQKRTL